MPGRALIPLRRLARVPFRYVRWKIILPYAFLVVVLATAGTYLATSQVQNSLDERFQNQLADSARTAGDSVVRREQSHLEVARSVAFTQGIPDAIQSGNAATIAGVITNIAANTNTERIDVVDIDGARVIGVQLTDPETVQYASTLGADSPSTWPLVGLTLNDIDGKKYAQLIETESGTMLITAVPVYDDLRLVGAAIVGTSLETLVARMKSEALADVTIYDFTGSPIGSTFVMDEREANLFTTEATLAPAGPEDAVTRQSRAIWGRRYDFIYSPMEIGGTTIGYYSVALPSDFIFAAANDTRWTMTLVFGLGMAATLIVGLFLARSITTRVQRLVTAAERVTEGDLSARTDIGSEDEIGRLTDCFNRMTDRLEGQYIATMRSLASAVAGANPYTVNHSMAVGKLASHLGKELGVDEYTLAQLEIGGYLHDLGKIGVRDTGVVKDVKITPRHRHFINTHPHIGIEAQETAGVAESVQSFIEARTSIRGADDERSKIVPRIVAVADLYEALTAERPNEAPMTAEEALEIMRQEAGKYLHFGTLDALTRILPEWERSQGRGSDYRALAEPGGRP